MSQGQGRVLYAVIKGARWPVGERNNLAAMYFMAAKSVLSVCGLLD